MNDLDELLVRLEQLLGELEVLDEGVRARVFELLDGVDALHRMALTALGDALGPRDIERLRAAHPAVAWLFDAYAVGVDERAAAEASLEPILPYIHSHGGQVEVLDAAEGIVRLRMSGACSGCTASAVTLQEGIEDALREGFPGFLAIDLVEDEAAPHPPPGPTLVQIQPRPR